MTQPWSDVDVAQPGTPEAAARLCLAQARERPDVPIVDEQHRGQHRMAERLVARCRDDLRHVHGVGWHWCAVHVRAHDPGDPRRRWAA